MLKTGPEITKINESSRERKNNSEIKIKDMSTQRTSEKRNKFSHNNN